MTKYTAEGNTDGGSKKIDDADKDNTKKPKYLESEILDWLIHGEDYFSVKYVVLYFVDEQDGEDGYTAKVPFEITKKEHLVFFEYAKSLCSICDSGLVYLSGCDLVDRPEFLKEYGESRRVDEDFLASVEEAVDDEDVRSMTAIKVERRAGCLYRVIIRG